MGKTVNPNYVQASFARVADDGGANAGTLSTTNANTTESIDTVFRSRFLIQQTEAATTDLDQNFELFYSYNSGSYTAVPAKGATSAPIRFAADSQSITDGATTTSRIGSGTFIDGEWRESDPSGSISFTNGSATETEMEFCVEVYGDYSGLANDDTIDLRVYYKTGTALGGGYTNTHRVTVTGVPVNVNADAPTAAIAGEAQAPSDVTGDANYTLTGAEISGDAGTSESQVNTSIDLTGAESAAEAQAPANVTGDANYTLTGAESAAEAGTVTAVVPRPSVGPFQFAAHGLAVNGYGSFAKSGGVNANVTGAASAAEAQAPANVTGDANYTLTGAESAAEAGAPADVTADVNYSATGAEVAGEAQAPADVTTDVNYTVTGAESPAEAGTVEAVTPDVSVDLTGAAIAGEAQAVTVTGDANYTLAGAAIAAEAAAPSNVTGDVNFTLTGAATAGESQAPTVTGDSNYTVTGAAIAGEAAAPTVTTGSVRPSVGPFKFASHGLSVKAYGSFSKAAPPDVDAEPVGAAIAGEAGTSIGVVPADFSAVLVPVSLSDPSVNVASGSWSDVDNGVDTGDGEVALASIVNKWNGYAVGSTASAFEFGITDVPADFESFVSITLRIKARTNGGAVDDNVSYLVDINGTNAPTNTLFWNAGDDGVYVTRSFTDSSVSPSASDINGWTVRFWQDLFNKVRGNDGLYLEIDEVELTLVYGKAITGAEIAAEAGTVTALSGTPVNVSGAEISGEAGTASASDDVDATITGAAISAESGVSNSYVVGANTRALAPHGLVVAEYGRFLRAQTVPIIGAQTAASAGVVNATADQILVKYELGPHGLTNRKRDFSPKQQDAQNENVPIIGADIQLQWATPDLADADIYTDGRDSGAEAGSVKSSEAFISGAAIAGEAGTVTVSVDIDAYVYEVLYTGVHTYAESQPALIDETASWVDDELVGYILRNLTDGSEGVILSNLLWAVEAPLSGGTENDWDVGDAYEIIRGAVKISGEAGESSGIGTITNDVNVTAPSAAIVAEAGTVAVPNISVGIDGAEIQALASNVAAPSGASVALPPPDEIRAEAGTVTASTDETADITGAEISADAGEVAARTSFDAAATIAGAEIAAATGTVTVSGDWSQNLTGAQINAQASEVGLDFKTGVSPTIEGAQINAIGADPALAGPHVSVNIVGARIRCLASSEKQADEEEQNAGGWAALNAYDAYKQRRRRRKKKRKEYEDYLETLEGIDREIAQLLQEPEEEIALRELEELVTEYQDQLEEARAFNDRVATALERAARQRNYSALMAFQREIERAIEEDEFLMLAIAILE